jgi:hypothetical protein
LVGAVTHFEDGHCETCLGQDNARRAVHGFLKQKNANFTLERIGYGNDATGGYDSDGNNYVCHGCDKEFPTLKQMIQHQQMKQKCVHLTRGIRPMMLQLGA